MNLTYFFVLIFNILSILYCYKKSLAIALPNEFHVLIRKKNNAIKVISGPAKYLYMPGKTVLKIIPSNIIDCGIILINGADSEGLKKEYQLAMSFRISIPQKLVANMAKISKNSIVMCLIEFAEVFLNENKDFDPKRDYRAFKEHLTDEAQKIGIDIIKCIFIKD